MPRFQRATWAFAAVAASSLVLAACNDPLEVENVNNPDRFSVLNLPRDVESLASKLYQNVHTATAGASADGLYPQMLTMSFENASSLNNFGMGPRSGIPRGFIDNTRGNNFQNENRRDFRDLQIAARTATTVMERIATDGFTLGSAGADLRLKAFTWFSYGTALGNVALTYDSAAVPLPGDGENVPPLQGHKEVMDAALKALDSAQAYATTEMTPLAADWLASTGTIDAAGLTRIIRAYKARFRANLARTPEERAAVDWAQVIADANAGLTADFVLQLNPGAGWNYGWLVQHHTTGSATWHQMVPYIINMADTTGAFDAWLAVPRNGRSPFLIRTPDKRFPPGETRVAQNLASPATGFPAGQYFRNRPAGEDQANTGWNTGFYDNNRWRALFNALRIGPWVTFSKVENDMLAAEGYIRTGNIAAAAALIDKSRVRNGLPALAGVVTTATQPVPGGNACVPRIPVGPTYKVTACGNILEAMKWEKRMETSYAAYGAWFFDGRGWGDLPVGTTLEWPVPWQEMDARTLPFYNLGGIGGPSAAGPNSTYGYGNTSDL